MTRTTLLRAASLTTLCLVGCTDQKHIVLGSHGPGVAYFQTATGARQLAVDANSLYWLSWDVPPPPGWQGNETSLLYVTKSDKAGNNATVISQTGFSSDKVYNNYALQVDTSYAYFADTGFVSKARLDGSGVTTIVPLSAQQGIGGLAIDDGMIYWTQSEGLEQLPKAGGMPTLMSMNNLLTGQVAVDTNSVYWIGSNLTNLAGELTRIDKTGGSESALAPADYSTSLLGENSTVYLVANNVVKKITSVGGPPTVVMSGATITSDLARDADHLYVVTDNTTIVKIAKADYSQTILVQGAMGDPNITNLAVDDTDVYWSNDHGEISHVAKN